MRDKRMKRYIIACVISLLCVNVMMQIYQLPKMKGLFTEYVSDSNMVPYALYVILFFMTFFVSCVLISKLSDFGCQRTQDDFTKGKQWAIVIGWCPAVLNGLLLLIGFAVEERLFDGPTWKQFIFHAFEPIAIVYMCVMFAVVYRVLTSDKLQVKKSRDILSAVADAVTKLREKLSKRRMPNRCIYIMVSVFAILLAVGFFTPNSYKEHYSLYHADAYFNSVYNYMQGAARTELNGSVYGYYGIILAPVVKLLGGSYTAFCAVISVLGALCYVCIAYIIMNLVRNVWVKIAGILAVPVYSLCFSYSVYRQLIPHRILFATIITAYMVHLIKRADNKYGVLGYVICILAIVWNLETGIVCLVGYTAFWMINVAKNKGFNNIGFYLWLFVRLMAAAFTVVMSYIFVNVVNYAMGGQAVTLKMFVFPLMSDAYMTNELAVAYPTGVVAWIMVAALCFAVSAYCLLKTKLVPKEVRISEVAEDYIRVEQITQKAGRDGVCFSIAVVVLGLMTYYINRCAYGNLQIVYMHAIVLMCVVLDVCVCRYANIRDGVMKHYYLSFACLIFTILISLVSGGIINYPVINYHRWRSEYKDMSQVELFKEELVQCCDKDTKAIGYIVPLIYSELGWDSGYYLMDIADLDIDKRLMIHISEELNGCKDKAILIDEYTYGRLMEADGLSKFNESYDCAKTFILYDTKLMYFELMGEIYD